jgi:hypothetical protein
LNLATSFVVVLVRALSDIDEIRRQVGALAVLGKSDKAIRGHKAIRGQGDKG